MQKWECEQRGKDNRCRTTGYMCRYVCAAGRFKNGGPCLFDARWLKSKQVQKMVASIRAVKPGSRITYPYRMKYGFYTREVIASTGGTVLSIDDYGVMQIEMDALKGIWTYGPEDFTTMIYLYKEEMQEKMEQLQQELEEKERIEAERRDEEYE